MLIKSGSLFFRFSLFVSFLVGFVLFAVVVSALAFFSFFLSLRGSLLRSPLRFLFSLFFRAPLSLCFFSALLFPRSLLLARFCARGAFSLFFPRARFRLCLFALALFLFAFALVFLGSLSLARFLRSFPSCFRFVEPV